MVAPTSSSSLARARNPRAIASIVVGLAAVAAVPAGVLVARYSARVTLVQAGASAGVGAVLGLYAIVLARQARARIQRTLGRAGGEGAIRAGKALAVLGLWGSFSAGLAIGFFGLLTLFD